MVIAIYSKSVAIFCHGTTRFEDTFNGVKFSTSKNGTCLRLVRLTTIDLKEAHSNRYHD